jgi:hypothetical protein
VTATFLAGHFAGIAVGALLTLIWSARRHARIRAAQVENLLAHMARHPAGRNIPDGEPFHARTVCGYEISGDSLGDLLVNEVYHSRTCEQMNRRAL